MSKSQMLGKKPSSTLPAVLEKEKRQRHTRLALRRENPQFREHLRSVRQKIAGGQALSDIRESIDETDLYFQDLMHVLATAFADPAMMMLEWNIRNQSRYTQAAQLMNDARANPDPDARFEQMSRAIMIASKLDENTLDLHKALGLIKPIENEDDIHSIRSEELDEARRRFESIIDNRILDKISAERNPELPKPLQFFTGSEPGREADRLEDAPLAEGSPDGQKPGDHL